MSFRSSSSANFQWKSSSTIGKPPRLYYPSRRATSHYLGPPRGFRKLVAAPPSYHGECSRTANRQAAPPHRIRRTTFPRIRDIVPSLVEVDYYFIDIPGGGTCSPRIPKRTERSLRRMARGVVCEGLTASSRRTRPSTSTRRTSKHYPAQSAASSCTAPAAAAPVLGHAPPRGGKPNSRPVLLKRATITPAQSAASSCATPAPALAPRHAAENRTCAPVL